LSPPTVVSSVLFCQNTTTNGQAQSSPIQAPPTQAEPRNTPERENALQLYHAGKFVAAMPLLEKLSADNPSDVVVKEAWAYSIGEYAATLNDPELRKKSRMRARTIALEAKKLGDNSQLLQVMLDMPEDGSEPTFSSRKDVDEVMKAAEADFARGDLDKARDGYLHALLLDPNNYDAALFIGDSYFKQHVNGSAGEWFARAIQIDPNRETAYRYWGDALVDLNQPAEARAKFIQAVVAEPYNRRSWMGLNSWAQHAKVQFNWVKLQDKSKVSIGEKGATITLDSAAQKDDPIAVAGWMTYAAVRLTWQQKKFKEVFPAQPTYRRTLSEEVDALHSMVIFLSRPENISKLNSSLAVLVKIDQAGFIEPFALLNRVNNDIAQDYAGYRTANREKIYGYLDQIVVPKAPAQ
jgi:tetratricopeptide (TPR) repeat protein